MHLPDTAVEVLFLVDEAGLALLLGPDVDRFRSPQPGGQRLDGPVQLVRFRLARIHGRPCVIQLVFEPVPPLFDGRDVILRLVLAVELQLPQELQDRLLAVLYLGPERRGVRLRAAYGLFQILDAFIVLGHPVVELHGALCPPPFFIDPPYQAFELSGQLGQPLFDPGLQPVGYMLSHAFRGKLFYDRPFKVRLALQLPRLGAHLAGFR